MLSLIIRNMNVKRNATNFDYKDMHMKLCSFKEKFSYLETLNDVDKIGFTNEGDLYVNKKGVFQSTSRWWYGQNKKISINTLVEQLQEYFILINIKAPKIDNK